MGERRGGAAFPARRPDAGCRGARRPDRPPPMADFDFVVSGRGHLRRHGGSRPRGGAGHRGETGLPRWASACPAPPCWTRAGWRRRRASSTPTRTRTSRCWWTPGLEPKLRQGITLELFGQDGISIAPVRAQDVRQPPPATGGAAHQPGRLVGLALGGGLPGRGGAGPARAGRRVPGAPRRGARVRRWGWRTARPPPPSWSGCRRCSPRGWTRAPTGCPPASSTRPAATATRDELVSLCEVAASRHTPMVVHLRSESDRLLGGDGRDVRGGQRRPASTCTCRTSRLPDGTTGPSWSSVIARAEAAERAGVKVTADQYPYIAGSTMMGAILPPWVHAGGTEKALERLAIPRPGRASRRELLDTSEVDWDNFWKWSGPEGFAISDVPSRQQPRPDWQVREGRGGRRGEGSGGVRAGPAAGGEARAWRWCPSASPRRWWSG